MHIHHMICWMYWWQTVAADAACRVFDGVVDRAGLAALEQRAAAGQVPRPVAWGTIGAGEWLEFDREWRPPPGEPSSSVDCA